MNEPTIATPLPTTLEACHSMIRDLQRQMDVRSRLIKSLMGYDPTDTQAVTAFQRSFAEALSKVDPAAVAAEVAAEDWMRQRSRKRNKKI